MDGCPYSRILSPCDWLMVCVAISENLNFFRDALYEFDDGGHQPLTLGPTGGTFFAINGEPEHCLR